MSSYDPLIFLQQAGLKSLRLYSGALDGEEGPLTRKGRDAFLLTHATLPLPGIASRIIDLARGELYVRETSKNQGEGIAKYWTATTYPDGYANREPYCAAFVCWILREATRGHVTTYSLPTSPVAYDISKWAAANATKGVRTIANPADAKPGDIFTLATASHTGLVLRAEGGLLHTIEGNTDGSGSREGDGVYQRTRSHASIRSLHRIEI